MDGFVVRSDDGSDFADSPPPAKKVRATSLLQTSQNGPRSASALYTEPSTRILQAKKSPVAKAPAKSKTAKAPAKTTTAAAKKATTADKPKKAPAKPKAAAAKPKAGAAATKKRKAVESDEDDNDDGSDAENHPAAAMDLDSEPESDAPTTSKKAAAKTTTAKAGTKSVSDTYQKVLKGFTGVMKHHTDAQNASSPKSTIS
jgi:hypothetical protein